MIKIAVITNIIPTYREGFYDRLFSEPDISVTVFCQDDIPGLNLPSIHKKYGNRINIVKYFSTYKEKICWQFLPWTNLFNNYDVVFVGGNPRIISDLLISTALHICGKHIVHWTMVRSFRANSFTEFIRLLWSKIFKNIFVYTDAEAEYLVRKGFKNKFILGMNNGLDQKKIDFSASKWTASKLKEWRYKNKLEEKILILSCARLESKNKFHQVIQALPQIIASIPNCVWCVIGDGDSKASMNELVKNLGLDNNVRFVGALYKEEELAPWFLSSEILIHPAAIGLTLMHAFGYGLPVITHGCLEMHNPEYAAFEPELTGRNFQIDNICSLAETVIALLNDSSARIIMKKNVLTIAREKYNIDIMVDRFIEIARVASSK